MIPKLNDILNMTSHLSGDWTQFETHNFSRHWTRVGFQNPHIGHVWLFHKDRVLATPNQRQSPGRHPRRAGEWTPHDAAFRWMIDRHPETGSPGTVELYIYMPRRSDLCFDRKRPHVEWLVVQNSTQVPGTSC